MQTDLRDDEGIAFLSFLRDLPDGNAVRVVVTGTQDQWRYSVVGVRDFLQTPLEGGALDEGVRGVLQRLGLIARG